MSTPKPLEIKNVQGDILSGLPKKVETYWFIQIQKDQVDQFRTALGQLVPLITTTSDVLRCRWEIGHHKKHGDKKGHLLKLSGVNVAFSQKGLTILGIKDKIGDAPFEGGMLSDASNLNDRVSTWHSEFQQDIHCLFLISGESKPTTEEKLSKIKKILGSTVKEVKRADGNVRPREFDGHEHFGYLDGVSQPAVLGFDDALQAGQELVRQGIILLGREGDSDTDGVPLSRPAWALDGSFLCFRYLSQLVPEFQGFVDKNNPPGAPDDFFGSRLVGRWKSGAPIDITPLKDVPALGKDPSETNNFRYDPFSQARCPYAAHTRKTNPRADLPSTETRRILRRGIQFGPEVTDEEKSKGTIHDRGLLFVSYQSQIANGFQFIQKSWANNPTFPFLFKFPTPKPGFGAQNGPGFDPIIGQAADGGVRAVDLQNGDDPAGKVNLPVEWVVSRGGEYFFSPSIPALRDAFAKTTAVSNGAKETKSAAGVRDEL